ncbi:HAMP domain-containing sensor histidine kinase [Bacillus spongiae]|uniref:histidine kinase n=1 Tax=Bacillus spongiae TaxID=2683610 RepID=A0ABU8HFN9_9BACI
MAKIRRSFRAKIAVLVSLSMISSGIVTYTMYKVLQILYRMMAWAQFENFSLVPLRIFFEEIEYFFVLFIFFSFSILFFFLFSKPYANYFNEISMGITHLAEGNFNHRVQIVSNDEFGELAKEINLASQKFEEATERGEFSESSKNQLVVNLAHDLRTPLTSVLGYLDLILKNNDLTAEQVHHYLTIAFTKSQRLERLIDELFEITRMNYGMLPIKKMDINISDLLIQLSEEMYPVLEKKHLQVRMNVVPHLPTYSDGDLLARVFENLLTNASRYGYEGEYVDINGFIESDDVVVQVVNYGDRIPPDELPHLFDMFYTGDKARTQQKKSTGLGLFIAKNIVEQHNGTIKAESSIIRTMFEVRLPLENKPDDEIIPAENDLRKI